MQTNTDRPTVDEIPVAIVNRLLAELTPTKIAKHRIGARALKRAVMQASAKTHGEDFYAPTKQFAEIAEAAGFPVEPVLPMRVDDPVRGWSIGVSPRSLDAFLQRHQVFPF